MNANDSVENCSFDIAQSDVEYRATGLRRLKLFLFDEVKRCIDVFGAACLVFLLLPLMIVVAVMVKLTSRGPIIFSQIRLTEGGRIFTMYKFRTMAQNAEAGSGAVWAQSKDPRVTPIGRFLRMSRLDELPQLLNVLIGDMSLIGPRPERPEFAIELARRLPGFVRRLEVKAGCTGLAQVSSGYASSLSSYRSKLRYDIIYVEKRSVILDIVILFKTIRVIFTGSGAR